MSVVWKKLYSNVNRPQVFAFSFTGPDSSETTTDGYSCTVGGVSVARGDADGYYTCTLGRNFGASDIIYADAKVYEATYPNEANLKSAQVIDQDASSGTITVVTRGANGAVAPLVDYVVQVYLLIKGIN